MKIALIKKKSEANNTTPRRNADKTLKYPAETTANAAKIPRQMSLFIKQDRITSNLRNDSETNATQRKHHILIPRKRNTRQIQNNQIKTFIISRLASTNQHQHKTLTN